MPDDAWHGTCPGDVEVETKDSRRRVWVSKLFHLGKVNSIMPSSAMSFCGVKPTVRVEYLPTVLSERERYSAVNAPAVGVIVMEAADDSIGTQEDPLLLYELTEKWCDSAEKEGLVTPVTLKLISVNVVGNALSQVRMRTSRLKSQ
jgi:hypothetical protein